MGLQEQIKVQIEAYVKGMNHLQQLEKELRQIEKLASKKVTVNVTSGGLNSGIRQAVSDAKEGFAGLEKAAASIAVVVSAVGALSAATFALAKHTADAGSQIHDLSQATGFSAELLSGLKVGADESGSSLEEVSAGLIKFEKLVGEAAAGSKEATAKLIALGVDPREAIKDLDGALAKAFQTINDAPPGVRQVKLAIDGFGKSGANLIPVIRGIDGNLSGATEKAKELGQSFSGAAADAADEFGDALDDLQKQAEGTGFTIGNAVIPEITKGLKTARVALRDNKQAVEDLAGAIAGAIGYAESFVGFLSKISYYTARGTRALVGGRNFDTEQLFSGANFGAEIAGATKRAIIKSPDALADQELIDKKKKLGDIVAELEQRVKTYGDTTERAATRQKLLGLGVDATTDALAQQALAYADLIDKINKETQALRKQGDLAVAEAARRGAALKSLGEQRQDLLDARAAGNTGIVGRTILGTYNKELGDIAANLLNGQELLALLQQLREFQRDDTLGTNEARNKFQTLAENLSADKTKGNYSGGLKCHNRCIDKVWLNSSI